MHGGGKTVAVSDKGYMSSILFHKKLNPGIGTRPVLNLLKKHIKMQQGDHPYSKDLEVIAELIRSGKIVKSVLNNVSLK